MAVGNHPTLAASSTRQFHLGRASKRIDSSALSDAALKSAEQRGNAVQVQKGGDLEEAVQELGSEFFHIVTRKPGGDQGVIVRPTGPVVVRHGIVPPLAPGD